MDFRAFCSGWASGSESECCSRRSRVRKRAWLIKNKAEEGTDYIKQRGSELKDTATGWVDKGKDAVGRQKENMNDAVEAGKQAYRDAVS